MTDARQPITISLSLKEIYQTICPGCREALLALLSQKAHTNMFLDALRASLDPPPCQPECSEESPP